LDSEALHRCLRARAETGIWRDPAYMQIDGYSFLLDVDYFWIRRDRYTELPNWGNTGACRGKMIMSYLGKVEMSY